MKGQKQRDQTLNCDPKHSTVVDFTSCKLRKAETHNTRKQRMRGGLSMPRMATMTRRHCTGAEALGLEGSRYLLTYNRSSPFVTAGT